MTFHTFARIFSVRRGSLPALLALVVLISTLVTAIDRPEEVRAATFRHLALRSSVPAADATVGRTLEEVRLFFTEAPQIAATSIRIADGMNELVPSTEAAADGEDPVQVFIRTEAALEPGSYTVYWRAMAQDGHTENGDFGFQVMTE